MKDPQIKQFFKMIKEGFDALIKALTGTKSIEIKGAEFVAIKGDKGDTPTDEHLLTLITPLIPKLTQPADGHTPTDEELVALIRPLIPEVKDGETPTDERLLALIKTLIPDVKDGETPTDERLVSLIKPLIPDVKDGETPSDKRIIEIATPILKEIEGGLVERFTKQPGGYNGIPDSEIDGKVYSRRNGYWVEEITVSETPPANPYLNQLWYDIS